MNEDEYRRFMPGNETGDESVPANNPLGESSESKDVVSDSKEDNIPTDTLPYFKEKAREASRLSGELENREKDYAAPSPEKEDESYSPEEDSDNKLLTPWLWAAIGMPVAAIICFVVGLAIGTNRQLSNPFLSKEDKEREMVNQAILEKFGPAVYTVYSEYVDVLEIDTILDMALKGMMNSLDPHSLYIPSSQLEKANEDLEGEFSGVGVSFILYNDSVAVVDVIKGGPASGIGLQRGDRILSANGINLTGKEITSDSVYKTLRGKQGSSVNMQIYRPSSSKKMNVKIKRGAVPINSVDAYYMLDDGKTGYIKISSFSSNTYSETMNALNRLRAKGAKDFVIDLRGNPGGFMDQAILIANEFLPAGRGIVYTKARKKENEMNVRADGTGAFQNSKVAVVLDENSASASEILAGAIQDNDRGVIVGRRSFGKGLVQNQFDNAGGGALRLTVARYFTPSGRSIQKEYTLGNHDKYSEDIISRYNHGELFNADSIKLDKSKLFKTIGGRNVYGGGGIMPDIFVPEDTSSYTPYYVDAMNSGLIMNFAYKIADTYRPLLKNVKTEEQLFRIIPDDSRLLTAFVNYAEENGLPGAWYYINMSSDMIVNKIKAFIARDILNDNLFFKIYNTDDTTLKRAREALKSAKLPNEPQMR